MSRFRPSSRIVTVLTAITVVTAVGASAGPAAARSAATYQVGPITRVSTCGGQNAEVEQAVDARLGYVYGEWMGCKGIGFARSADGGRTWSAPVDLPGTGSNINTWDPALAVAPDGTVYASFMLSRNGQYYPVVDASFDHGATFSQSSSLIPISADYGSSAVWPGDTTGLSVLSPTDVVASWGSDYPDVSGKQAEIYAASVAATLPYRGGG